MINRGYFSSKTGDAALYFSPLFFLHPIPIRSSKDLLYNQQIRRASLHELLGTVFYCICEVYSLLPLAVCTCRAGTRDFRITLPLRKAAGWAADG
jgi:hypothetical protein